MYFYLSRPLMNSIIIDVQTVEGLKFATSEYAKFNEEDLERIFSEKRRNKKSQLWSTDDKNFLVMRLTDKECKNSWIKVCPECVKNDDTRYIPDDVPMCDQHLLVKYELDITYDSCDREGLVDLLFAEDVIKVLRRLDDN